MMFLVIFTDAPYHCKHGQSSFGSIFMLNNVLIYAGGHYGPKLNSPKAAEAMTIRFALRNLPVGVFSRVVLFSDAKEVLDTINGQMD